MKTLRTCRHELKSKLKAWTHADHVSAALEERDLFEDLADPLPGNKHGPQINEPGDEERPHVQSARCIAYDDHGHICGREAKHLDIVRGGFVCGFHRGAL